MGTGTVGRGNQYDKGGNWENGGQELGGWEAAEGGKEVGSRGKEVGFHEKRGWKPKEKREESRRKGGGNPGGKGVRTWEKRVGNLRGKGLGTAGEMGVGIGR